MGIWRARAIGPIVYSSLTLCKKTVASSFSSCRFLFLTQPQRTLASLSSEQERYIPVKAYFLCTGIDLKSLQQAQNADNVIRPSSRATNSVVLRYYDIKNGAEAGFGSESNSHYMVVFQYGSIALFNVSDHEVDGYLRMVEKHASSLLPEMIKDDYLVVEKPNLETWMQGGLDHIMLKNLSIDGIQTIGRVLAQSLALDYYTAQVDGLIAQFRDIHCDLGKTGILTLQSKKLFQHLGMANSSVSDVILKLGVFERSDIAWKDANYAKIWEYLRDQYELSKRIESLAVKRKVVEDNILSLRQIMQHMRSDFLEWLIIILISVDILISGYTIAQMSNLSKLI